MTNYEYIISQMTDVKLAQLIHSVYAPVPDFVWKIIAAHDKWAGSLKRNQGNMYYIEEPSEENPSVFNNSFLNYYNNKKDMVKIGNSENMYIVAPRADALSMQVWLSKQYNEDEWKDDKE